MAPGTNSTSSAHHRKATTSLSDLAKYFHDLRTRVCDVPISIDFNTWRVNLSLLSMQTLILYGTLVSEYRFSLFVFSSVWLGRSFFYAEYLKKYGPRGSLVHNLSKGSVFRSFSVSGFMITASFCFLLRSTRNYQQLCVYLLLPCACMLLAERFRNHPRVGTALQFVFALEQAYMTGIVTLILDVNPTLIYDRSAAYAVIWTALFNNFMAAAAKYFIVHYTQHQIDAHNLCGWKWLHEAPVDAEAWVRGGDYKRGAIVRHHGGTFEAVGTRNQAEPGSWSSQLFMFLWNRPYRLLTFLMTLQVLHVIGIGIFSFCCDSLMIMGGMMFVSADYMQLMHSIRFALLGKSFRNVMLRPQSAADHANAATMDAAAAAMATIPQLA
ncbi:Aste57867_24678 [Aphanomyces stellatus]|uniref:Aste57867_24678 protein n=1 Tax=Aphanomyces stellatus TaxID=120398 RepID=A0A485LR24_9STRA|nr:hypothetical protein As57867_024600 [Aphanomyces stellatus]VFU01315.1 Aste57867_24678 [Aphanomyces stellatus]